MKLEFFKLKKVYDLYIDTKLKILPDKSFEFTRDPELYSRVYKNTEKKMSNKYVVIPFSQFETFSKKNLAFRYKLENVDETNRKIYFKWTGIQMIEYLNTESRFPFNKTFRLKKDRMDVVFKILWCKNVPKKCSESVQKTILEQIQKYCLTTSVLDTPEDLMNHLMNRTLKKIMLSEVEKVEYIKTIVLVKAKYE